MIRGAVIGTWTMIVCFASLAMAGDADGSRPNFVFIQGEGQGWASTSIEIDPSEPFSKSRSFSTPNLERLAREGVRFSNYYAPSPRCTPSRASITASGIDFIQRQTSGGKPFYLQLSHYGGRSQDDAKPETSERVLKSGLGRDQRSIGAAAVALDMDISIGMVLDKLDELKIADKTYVIYTADHGTPGRNGPLRGGKGGLWDGGIRIPLLVRGPIAKANAHSSLLTTGADLVPTVADLAGVAELPNELEGGSLRAALADPATATVKRRRDELVFHFPHYDKDQDGSVSREEIQVFPPTTPPPTGDSER